MKKLLLAFMFGMLLLSFASALEFDNIVSPVDVARDSPLRMDEKTLEYNKLWETYKPIEITNAFGMGSKLVEGAITEHTESCSNDCKTRFTICNYEDTAPIKDVLFYRIMDNGDRVLSNIRSYQWWIKTEDSVCSEITDINGTRYNSCTEEKWKEYNYEVEKGCFDYELRGDKRAEWTYDFVPIIAGKEVTEWAVWGGSSNVYETNATTWNLPQTQLNRQGVQINVTGNFSTISVQRASGADGTNFLLYNGDETSSLASAGFNGSGYGTINYNFVAGNLYLLLADGSNRVMSANMAQGAINSNLRLVQGWDTVAQGDISINIWKIYVSTIGSQVNLNSPADNYTTNQSQNAFNFTAIMVGATFANASLWTNDTGAWAIRNSTTTNGKIMNWNFTTDGKYKWGIRACDSDGACGWSENRTITTNTITPIINILSPKGTTDYGYIGQNLSLNYSISNTNPQNCWYNYSGLNYFINCSLNSTFVLGSSLSLIIYANTSAGNLGFNSTNFNYIIKANNISYATTAVSTNTESFILNASYNSTAYSIITAKFNYNNTNYSTTITGSGEALVSSTISLPLIQTTTNKTFYWIMSFDGVNYTTSQYNQTVTPLAFGICSDVLTSRVINFTTKSAENPFPIVNATFKSAWEVSSTQDGLLTQYNFEDVNGNITNWNFCTDENTTVYASAQIEYDSTGYALNSYYISNATLTNGTDVQSISLYLLNDSIATTTVLSVRDNSKFGLEDVLIQVQLYDVGTGTFYTVSMAKTDYKGEDVVYLNWYDSLYKFTLIQGNELIMITNTTRITSTPTYFDIKDTTTNIFDKFENFVYSLTFNNVTNNFVLTFVKPSGEVDSGCLRVTKRSLANDTEICLLCETSSSATLSCNINGYGNGTYIATFYATGSYLKIDWLAHVVGGSLASTIYAALGKEDASFYAFLFTGIVLSMSFINPVFGIVGLLLGILGGAALGFSLLNYAAFIGLCAVGVIIIWFLKR